MEIVFIIVLAVIAVGLAGGMAVMATRASKLAQKLKETTDQIDGSRDENGRLRAGNMALVKKLEDAAAEDQKKVGWLDHQEKEMTWLRAELEKRPKVSRKTYKVLTLGMKWTGKTSLTLKWANPLVDLGAIQGTKIERYERTVSQVVQKDITTEHVFEIGDWGGEHIVDAQQELIMDEIHGLLIVVDLGGKDAKKVDPQRIQDQLREFQAQALKYFFGPKTVASCKAVVLFINKSDLIPGTPAEVEEHAKKYYTPLIDDLMRYSTQVDVRILVGSANYGHSTHFLFSHFVEKILPKNAYDNQLMQRMKQEFSAPVRHPGAAQQPGGLQHGGLVPSGTAKLPR